jgi:hypothetical protein
MTVQEAYDTLAKDLEHAGIIKSHMFGMPVLKLGKKPIAGLVKDGVNFKLPVGSNEYVKALRLKGAHVFQPEMHGRRGPLMKQWIVVPPDNSAEYDEFAKASIQFVASQS